METGKKRKGSRRVIVVNVRKLMLLAVTVLLCVLTVISVCLLVYRFLRVGEYDVAGISRYDREELISASGVKKGTLLSLVDEEQVEEKILAECPYLSSVTVRTKFPDVLRIEVEGREAQWYLDIGGAKYTLDGELRVISEVVKPKGITKLSLPHIQSAIYGEVPLFGESETERKRTLEVIDIIRKTSFKERLTEVNLESRWDIHLEVDGSYDVSLGDLSDLEAKLRATEAVLAQESMQKYTSGSIVISKGVGGYTGAFMPNSDQKTPEKES